MTSYSFQAQVLADQAHHFTYGDGADPVAGGALATEALVYAVLSLSEQLYKLVAALTPAAPEPAPAEGHCLPTLRFPCGHCAHDLCQDCSRCCSCQCADPDAEG